MRIQLTLFSLFFISPVFGQTSSPAFLRHDTTLLKATECEWVYKSLVKNVTNLTAEREFSIPHFILHAIFEGKIIAFDPESDKPIPAKEIFKWKMAVDTVATIDKNEKIIYTVVPQQISAESINLIRIYQKWYFDISTSSMYSEIKSIELLQDVRTSNGNLIGKKAYCRVYY